MGRRCGQDKSMSVCMCQKMREGLWPGLAQLGIPAQFTPMAQIIAKCTANVIISRQSSVGYM